MPAARVAGTLRAGADGPNHPSANLEYATEIIRRICCLAGSADLVREIRATAEGRRLRAAIIAHDTPTLYNWLTQALSYQGISDRVADSYMEKHGTVTWRDVDDVIGNIGCRKLQSFWRFSECGFEKTSRTCKQPDHFDCCSLPRHDLRNGRLNQTAYSLYLFIRDIADCDLVGWIDDRLNAENATPRQTANGLVSSLRGIYGASDKVLAMSLSILLVAAPRRFRRWFETGINMVAIDTLVHNFLRRTGILSRLGADHAYGPACYKLGNCADIIYGAAQGIDARQLDPDFPASFPRFVQYAIWRYCSERGLNVCNGNRIDDRQKCDNIFCQIYSICDRNTQ
jgi:hypothetical protein